MKELRMSFGHRVSVYTGQQIKDAEAPLLQAGEGPALMSRAARGLAQRVVQLLNTEDAVRDGDLGAARPGPGLYGARVTGLIGSGNNGGDGLYALAMLRRRGVDARAVLVGRGCHTEALEAFRQAGGRVEDRVRAGTQIIIDAILGTGVRGEPNLPHVPGLRQATEDAVVVACDLPSGVDADTGRAGAGVIAADYTVTFGGLKQGLLVGAGAQLSGEITMVDIGLGPHLSPSLVTDGSSPAQRGDDVVPPGPEDHKYSRGVVQIMAGSPEFPGAAHLTAGAAVRTGVGMVVLQAPENVKAQVIGAYPEVIGIDAGTGMPLQGRAGAVVIGPGTSEESDAVNSASALLDAAIAAKIPCVLDASGLSLIRPRARRYGTAVTTGGSVLGHSVLITPHMGEAQRIAKYLRDPVLGEMLKPGSPTADPVEAARRLAGRLDCAVLLKGASTIIASPSAEVVVHRTLAPGLATAGSGDVLSGVLGALAATGSGEWIQTAGRAVRRHAAAAGRIDPAGEGRYGASALLGGLGG